MISLVVVCALTFAVGCIFGQNLAAKGITSDNALTNHQKPVAWLLIAIAPFLGILIILDKFNLAPLLPKIFPSMLLIYLAGYFNEIIVCLGCFFLGLLTFLELSGKRHRPKIVQLLIATGTISFALSILFVFLQPVQALVTQPKIIHGIVMQTTPYTCAPASIATLARYTQKNSQLTEREAVRLTKTNRFGTTTLSEIRAMKQLNLNPQYRHNLTINDLIVLNQPALMHVKEKRKKGKGVRFSHAVAYLTIDPAKELILIGNPLYGMQIKTFDDLEEYWFGEAILIGEAKKRHLSTNI
ncbi:MAG: cysteine peptidase family C39 domain-containing protein [Pleurocapsa sp.]